jgi:hypothetical protein
MAGTNGISIGEVSISPVSKERPRYGEGLTGKARVRALRAWKNGDREFLAYTWNPFRVLTPDDVYWATASPEVVGCECVNSPSHKLGCEVYT